MFCDQCGMEVEEGNLFCANCGNRVLQVSAPAGEQMSEPVEGVQFAPAGAQPPANKKKWLMYAGIGVAALLLLIVIASVGYRLILGKGGRVLAAVGATAKDAPMLVKDLQDIPKVLSGDQYLVGIEIGEDDQVVKGEFRNAKKDKQLYLNASLDEYDDLELLFGVHSGVARMSAKGLDYAFFYDPKAENDGFLTENLRKRDLEQLNSLLEGITSDQMSVETIGKNSRSALLKEFRKLEFEKAAPKKWKVNGKERKCTGYQVALDEDDIIAFWKAFSEAVKKDLKDDTKDAVSDMLDIVEDELDDLRFDADISFYLYKGKLAAVVAEGKDMEIRIEFRGGDYRMQNMVIVLKNDYISEKMTLSSERKGKTETTTIEADGVELELVYDAKSGEVTLEGEVGREDGCIEGIYRHSGSEVSFELEDFEVDGRSQMGGMSFMVYIKNKANFEKYEGEKFDLGNATEREFEDLADDLEDYIELLDDLMW